MIVVVGALAQPQLRAVLATTARRVPSWISATRAAMSWVAENSTKAAASRMIVPRPSWGSENTAMASRASTMRGCSTSNHDL